MMYAQETQTKLVDDALSILKHPIRRNILEALWEKDRTFLELVSICGIDHGKLGHHLRKMNNIVERDPGRRVFILTQEGRLIYEFITQGLFGLEKAINRYEKTGQAVNKYRNRFKTLFNLIPDPVAILDLKGKIIAINDVLEESTGFKRQELLGNNISRMKILTSKSKSEIRKNLVNIGFIGGQSQIEVEMLSKNNEKFSYEINLAAIEYEGKPAALVICRNITKRKHLEEELKGSKRFLETVINDVPDSIYIKDRNLRYVIVNRVYCDFQKISKDDIIGKKIYTIFPKDKADEIIKSDKEVFEKGEIQNNPGVTVTSQVGITRKFHIRKAPLKDDKGNITHIVCIGRDITEQRRAEDKLRKYTDHLEELVEERARKFLQSEKRYRSLFEGTRDAICMFTREGKTININRSALNLFGYTREEMLDINARKLYAYPKDRSRFREKIEKKGFVKDYKVKMRKKNGSIINCLMTSTARKADDGHIIEYQTIIREITG